MKGLYRVALLGLLTLGAISVGATSLEAAVIDPASDETARSFRVVNNYGEAVQVYAADDEGRMHLLGRVATGDTEVFEVPAAIGTETFRITVLPGQPVWVHRQDDFGVKSMPIDLWSDGQVTFWVEPDLEDSTVDFTRG